MEARWMLSAGGLSASVLPTPPGAGANAPQAAIHGSVLVATSHDCRAGSAGTGVPSVPIELLDETGAILDRVLTSHQGAYQFRDLPAGVYAVQQHLPVGLRAAAGHVGSGGGITLDASLIGEIIVAAGDQLGGYEFCARSTNTLDGQGGGEAPPVVAHANPAQVPATFVPLPTNLPMQTSGRLFAAWVAPPAPVATLAASLPLPRIQVPPRGDPIFGGSSQDLRDEANRLDEVSGEMFAQWSPAEKTADPRASASALPGDDSENFSRATDSAPEEAIREAVDEAVDEAFDEAFETGALEGEGSARLSTIAPTATGEAHGQLARAAASAK